MVALPHEPRHKARDVVCLLWRADHRTCKLAKAPVLENQSSCTPSSLFDLPYKRRDSLIIRKRPEKTEPSSLALLARYVLDKGTQLNFTWATVGGENLFPWQKSLIEAAFKCRCYQHYGSAEAVANFSECSAGNLHADEDFCIVELVPTKTSGQFSIVGTCLANYTMPFIRYETGDVCSGPVERCSCGKSGLVVSGIDGRTEDYVLLRNGRLLGRLDHIFKDAVNVREAQIVQVIPGKVTLRVVPTEAWKSRDAEALLHEFKKRTGSYLDIEIEYRTKLERTPSGKLRFVVSECKGGKLDAPRVELCGTRER